MMYEFAASVPIADERDTRRVCRILNENVDVIATRESASLRELRRYGVTKPVMAVTSDPALTAAGGAFGHCGRGA